MRRRLRRAAGDRPARPDRRRRTTRPAASPTGRTGSRAADGCSRRRRRTRQVQFIDAQDLGDWLVDLAERRDGRHLQRHAPRPQLARAARDLPRGERQRRELRAGSDGRCCTSTRSASGWSCRSGSPSRDSAALHEADVSRAVAAGLRFRPLEETVRDTSLELAVADRLVTPGRRLCADPSARPSCSRPGRGARRHGSGTRPSPTCAPRRTTVVHGGTARGVPRGKPPHS